MDYGYVLLIVIILIIILIIALLIRANNNNSYSQNKFLFHRIYHFQTGTYVVMRLAGDAQARITRVDQEGPAYVNVAATGGTHDDPLGLWIIHSTHDAGLAPTNPPSFAIQNSVTETFCSNADPNAGVIGYFGDTTAMIFGETDIGTPGTNNAWFYFEPATGLLPVITDLDLHITGLFYMRPTNIGQVAYVAKKDNSVMLNTVEGSGTRDLFALIVPANF